MTNLINDRCVQAGARTDVEHASGGSDLIDHYFSRLWRRRWSIIGNRRCHHRRWCLLVDYSRRWRLSDRSGDDCASYQPDAQRNQNIPSAVPVVIMVPGKR